MAMIKCIIAKLDVVLAQVLIEAVILEVNLNSGTDLGFNYLQHPQTSGNFTGVGAAGGDATSSHPTSSQVAYQCRRRCGRRFQLSWKIWWRPRCDRNCNR